MTASVPLGDSGLSLVFDPITNTTTIKDSSGDTIASVGGGSSGVTSAVFTEEQPNGTDGGDFNGGAWNKRALNTTAASASWASLNGSNQVVLDAGTYVVEAVACLFRVGCVKSRVEEVSPGSSTLIAGLNTQTDAGANPDSTTAPTLGVFTIAVQTTVEFQQRSTTTKATDGRGQACSFGVPEVYAQLKITKIG